MKNSVSSPRLEVSVKILLKNSAGEFLLLKRTQPYPDENFVRWDAIGGRINPGEPLYTALSREVEEETGLRLKKKIIIIFAQDILRVEGKHTVRITYTGSASGKIILNPQEHTEYGWFSLKEITKMRCDVYLKPVFAMLE